MRVRTRVRRFSVHVRKCTYVQNVLPRETQDAPPSIAMKISLRLFVFLRVESRDAVTRITRCREIFVGNQRTNQFSKNERHHKDADIFK